MMKDYPYVVLLMPEEFGEILDCMEEQLERAKAFPSAYRIELLARIVKRLRQGDASHICLDEEDVAA